jgi:hypothetical protein
MLRSVLFAILAAFATSSCSGSEFASGAARSAGKAKKDKSSKDEDEDPKPTTGQGGKDDPGDEEGGALEVDDDTEQSETPTGELEEDGDGAAEDEDLVEDDYVKNLPGVKVTKVGVNFEDKNDNDYNDAVLCFEGQFKVDGTNVVSIKKQAVIGSTFSSAGCSHLIKVEIVNKDGTKAKPITYNSKSSTPINMDFDVGSKLEVSMSIISGSCKGGSMHDANRAKVAPDLCNNK